MFFRTIINQSKIPWDSSTAAPLLLNEPMISDPKQNCKNFENPLFLPGKVR